MCTVGPPTRRAASAGKWASGAGLEDVGLSRWPSCLRQLLLIICLRQFPMLVLL